ncbi:hypothetical protein HN011_002620 [Eciton burchellii]|nr:hypothetical protein HN011_002620 [Eciton burchellii]
MLQTQHPDQCFSSMIFPAGPQPTAQQSTFVSIARELDKCWLSMLAYEPPSNEIHELASNGATNETNVINVKLSTGLNGHGPNKRRQTSEITRAEYREQLRFIAVSRLDADVESYTSKFGLQRAGVAPLHEESSS